MKGTKFIETDRLILRKITMNDSHDLFINCGSDIKTNEFLTFNCHKREETTKKWLVIGLKSMKIMALNGVLNKKTIKK